ncbi:MAG: asparagine synthase (glutamine-hydrolyzing), partial [Deltaproteobacteria bacterium]
RLLLLARDRSGEKPLYYGLVGNCFAFASEIKALHEIPGFSGKIDRCALALYMQYSYVPTPYSIYKGICKLPPGHWLAMGLEEVQNRCVSAPQMYWSLSTVAQVGTARPLSFETDNGAIEYLESCLRQAVRAQMVADVPLGAFLSGGVDSSTVVALMQAEARRRGASPVKTFSIGFHESAYDEARYAKAVAAHLGTDHTELYVSPEEAMAVIPNLPVIWDEPFADPSQIPTYLVSRLARRHVTVSLSGDGGDELFCGYNRYVLGYRVWRTLRVLPATVRTAFGFLLAHVPDQRFDRLLELLPGKIRPLQLGDRLPKLVEVLQCRKGEDFYQALVSHWKRPEDVVVDAVKPKTLFGQTECLEGLSGFRERMMYLDALIYLPDDILTKMDRASMAVGLESRVPLLDHRVVESAWRLPMSLKYRHGEGKWILRQVLYRHVPKGIIDRPKMGFSVPLERWLRGPLREWAESLLSERRLREEGFFASSPIRRMWQAHLAGERGWHFCLWNVLMFQAWLERQKM